LTAERRLRRHQRLGSADIAAILKSGTRSRSGRFQLYHRMNTAGCARLALVVSKRLAPRAVDRNRIRRLIRETFRAQQASLGTIDCVVRLSAAQGATRVGRIEIEQVFAKITPLTHG
jgi:ribonuclease P protein component